MEFFELREVLPLPSGKGPVCRGSSSASLVVEGFVNCQGWAAVVWCWPASSDGAGRRERPWSPVLAFGEPLTYLAYDCPRHPVRFQPANKLFLEYWELDTLQVALYVTSRAGGKVLPQKVHGFGPPPLRATSLRTR